MRFPPHVGETNKTRFPPHVGETNKMRFLPHVGESHRLGETNKTRFLPQEGGSHRLGTYPRRMRLNFISAISQSAGVSMSQAMRGSMTSARQFLERNVRSSRQASTRVK